jgi:tetratricopeptide (TPR) repeat protein
MRTAYDLSLRQSPRKRHPADPGDALPGNSLALLGDVPQPRELVTEKWQAHPHLEHSGATADHGNQRNARAPSPVEWNNLGTALRAAGRYGEARTAFREAGRLAPQDVDTALNLARLEMECGRYQRAYDMFRIVLDKSPQLVEVRIRAARACHEIGKKKCARLLVDGWPRWVLDDDMKAELAALLIQIGKPRDGLSLLKGVSDLSRISKRVLTCLVSSLAQAGRLKKARYCLAWLPPPENIHNPALREEVSTACAMLALRAGNLSGARRFLEFLETSPAPGTCRRAKPYFMLAEICFHLLDMEAAKKALVTGQCIRMKEAGIASPLMIESSRHVGGALCFGGMEALIPSTWPRSMIR